MTNINWSQFVNNYANSLTKTNVNNIQNNIVNDAIQIAQMKQPVIAEPYLPNTTAQLSQTTSELAMMNQLQMSEMLKELMSFPKNMEDVLSKLMTNISQNSTQTALMLLTSSINLNSLSAMLQTNSKEGIANLYKMLAQFNEIGLKVNDEQISNLSQIISLVGSSSQNEASSIKMLMLMYLPYLPLNNPEAFKLELSTGGNEGSLNSDDSVKILIATENYGNIQAEVFKTDKDGIKIELISSQTFPVKEFKILMKEESIKYNININIDTAQKEIFNKEKNKTIKTQVFMNTSPGVNPFLLLISNALIKNIHTIDSKENLKEIRKEKLKNGKS